jgi:FlaA1/EpsC-like NDP-sugar epimerase
MGATKLLAERLVAASHSYRGEGTIFSCVRFGNVLGSKGSVVPLFAKQIHSGGPVTVTDPSMTRFMMTIPQAIDLVMEAAAGAHGGEVFIFKMPALRLGDLAEVMIEELSPLYGFGPEEMEIEVIGARPGEKRYEELMTEEEASAAYETEKMYILNGKGRGLPKATSAARRRYLSNETKLLSKEEIKRLLTEGGFIETAPLAGQTSLQQGAVWTNAAEPVTAC